MPESTVDTETPSPPQPTNGRTTQPTSGRATQPSGRTALESAYRTLLTAYPPHYRERRGDEIVDHLLAGAAPGQRFPRAPEVIDIVQAGLLERCHIGRVPGLAGGLVAAAPTALALAAGIAGFLWWRVEGAPASTVGPVAYAAWLLAAVARAALRPSAGRFMIAVAVVTTVVVVPALALTPLGDRPPLWVLMALAGFGAAALIGTAPGLGAGPPTNEARLSGFAGAIAVVVCTSTLTQAWIVAPGGYYGATIARVGAVVVGAVAALAVTAAYHLLRGRPAHDRLWAAALLGLPAGWLGPFTVTDAASSSAPHFGRLAQVLFATCVAVAVMRQLAVTHRPGHRPQETDPGRLARAGWHAVGTAAGLAAWIALSYLGIAGPRPEAGTGPPLYVHATLGVLVTVGLAAGVTGTRSGAWRPVLTTAAGTAFSAWRPFLTAAAGTTVAAWLVAAYVNDWTLFSWDNFGHTAAVATSVALVPLSECVFVAARVRRWSNRWAATLVLVVALGWLAVLTIRYLPGWAPPLLGAAACVAAAQIPRRKTA